MANWKSLEEEDDFFGTAEESDPRRCEDGYELHSGLAVAESAATAQRFRTIGYHEAYEESKDIKLQEGFEAGYNSNFDVAMRIGELLGDVTMQARLNESSDTKNTSLKALRLAQDYLTEKEEKEGENDLNKLEEELTSSLSKTKTT
jgi:hypothetical protein